MSIGEMRAGWAGSTMTATRRSRSESNTAPCRVGALLGVVEVFGGVGDLIFKPRDEWHTFWNAGDSPARVLEIICPGGLEELLRQLGLMTSEPEPETLAALASSYSCDVDFERTGPLMEHHGLTF